MKSTLEQEIKKMIENQKGKQSNNSFITLEKISKEYNELIEKGLASPSGYNLMAINDKPTFTYEIN